MTPVEQKALDEELRYGLALESLRVIRLDELRQDLRFQLESYKSTIEDYLSKIPAKTNTFLHFNFFDANLIDGRAFRRISNNLEFRFATVSAGAILYFHEFFAYLMSRVDILPKIGAAAAELNQPFTFNPPKEYPSTRSVKRGLLRDVSPVCPDRLEFGKIMAVTASMFLIWHEVAHCVDGHISQGAFCLDEVDRPATQNAQLVLKRHTLEMDADAYALNRIMERMIIPRLLGDTPSLWESMLAINPEGTILYPAMVAINLMFRILARPETLPITQGNFLNGTHPHPLVRSHLCRVTAVEIAYAGGFDNQNHRWVANLAVKSAIDAAQIWKNITGFAEPLRVVAFDDFAFKDGSTRVSKYMGELLDCWHEIKPRLEEVALVPLSLSKYEKANANRSRC